MTGFIVFSVVLAGLLLLATLGSRRRLRETHLVVRFPPYSLAPTKPTRR